MARGNPKNKKRIGGKIYTRATQVWRDKASAKRAAKGMRKIGYKARVTFEDGYYCVYLRDRR